MVPLGVNIIIGPCKFKMQATVHHRGLSMHCSHYTNFIKCYGNTLYCGGGDGGGGGTEVVGCWCACEGGGGCKLNSYIHSSILMNTGRGIGTDTCDLEKMFPPDDLRF